MPDEAIYGVVLLAALAHALWNAMVKTSSDRLLTLLPMGPVTAVRETSVVFGAIIGIVVLRESFGPRRIAAACLVTAGIAALTLF